MSWSQQPPRAEPYPPHFGQPAAPDAEATMSSTPELLNGIAERSGRGDEQRSTIEQSNIEASDTFLPNEQSPRMSIQAMASEFMKEAQDFLPTQSGEDNTDPASNLPEWRPSVYSIDDAEAWLHADMLKTFNKIQLGDSDDADFETQFILIHAMDLFNAIFADPPMADLAWAADSIEYFNGYQTRGMKVVTDAGKSEDGILRTQSRCLLVFRELFKLHSEGLPKGSKTAGFDGTLKASERIKEVIKCMEIKHIARAVVEGYAKGISDLVQDPRGLYKARKDAAGGNSVRHAYTEVGRKTTVKSLKKGAASPRSNFAPSTAQSRAATSTESLKASTDQVYEGSPKKPAKKRKRAALNFNAFPVDVPGSRDATPNLSTQQPVFPPGDMSSSQQPQLQTQYDSSRWQNQLEPGPQPGSFSNALSFGDPLNSTRDSFDTNNAPRNDAGRFPTGQQNGRAAFDNNIYNNATPGAGFASLEDFEDYNSDDYELRQ